MRGKFFYLGLAIVLLTIFTLSGCGKDTEHQAIDKTEDETKLSKELNVFNWSDYIDPDVVKEFEEEFKVKVNYDTYSSNEELLAKLQAGATGYDVIFPSDYMVKIMADQGLLAPLNKQNIPNLKNISSDFMGLSFDRGNSYSVPYMWGTVGIGVNTDKVKEEVDSWEILWDPKYKGKISMLNDMRETIGVALKLQGYSLNSTNPAELEEAKAKLLEQKELVKIYDSENYKNLLLSGEVWLAQAWPGDVLIAQEENPDIVYVFPKEGGTIWMDNIAIPKGSKNKYTAEVFINFLLRPEISARLSTAIYYGNPNEASYKHTPREILDDPAIYPPMEHLMRTEWMTDLGEATIQWDRIWTEIKGQ